MTALPRLRTRRAGARRAHLLLVALLGLGLLVGCGVEVGSTAGGGAGGRGGSSVPPGFRRVTRPGVDVSVAVPKAWTDSDLTKQSMEEAQAKAKEMSPQFGALGGGMFSNAKGFLAIGGLPDGSVGDVIVGQVGMQLPSIPESMTSMVESQFRGVGGRDVSAKRIDIAGLDGRKGLRLDVTVDVGGKAMHLHEVLVPADAGLTVVAVQGDDETGDLILDSIRVG